MSTHVHFADYLAEQLSLLTSCGWKEDTCSSRRTTGSLRTRSTGHRPGPRRSVVGGGWAVWRHGYVNRVTQDVNRLAEQACERTSNDRCGSQTHRSALPHRGFPFVIHSLGATPPPSSGKKGEVPPKQVWRHPQTCRTRSQAESQLPPVENRWLVVPMQSPRRRCSPESLACAFRS